MTPGSASPFDRAAALSSAALSLLVRQRARWEHGVEAAEVLLAFHMAGLGRHQLTLDAVETFAGDQVTTGPSEGSWNADFELTAHAIMVAAAFPGVLGRDAVQRAAEFLLRDYGGTALGMSWSDEVGKTLLGLRALAVARHPRVGAIAKDALPWLLNSENFGLLINERYTAEFVAVVQELTELLGTEAMEIRVRDQAAEMKGILLRSLDEGLLQKGVLWNNDLRANGIAVEAMARALVDEAPPEVLHAVLEWFAQRQVSDGTFGTLLATARIAQGLAQLEYWLMRRRGLDDEAARAAVGRAHRGVTEGIPLAILWRSMRIQHDMERQARVIIVPDRAWRRLAWVAGTAIPAAIGLLTWLYGDLVKRAVLE